MRLEVNTAIALNNLIKEGQLLRYITQEEEDRSNQIDQLAEEIMTKNHRLKWIWLAGPSSAGKTTFTNRLSSKLQTLGVKTHQISLDNYFVNRDLTPRDAKGEYDYEHINALDLPLLERHLTQLTEGHTIEMPHFKFIHGKREFRGEMLNIAPDEIALIEGIHALNPRLTSYVDIAHSLKIYVCARTTLKLNDSTRISTTDNRLLRRLIRDYTYRGHSADRTFKMWPSVRAGEDKWIFPHQPLADREYNSALGYEISVLRPLAEPLLRALSIRSKGHSKAEELLHFLSHFEPIERSWVPERSILHEFIDPK
jgi:uridine kinase